MSELAVILAVLTALCFAASLGLFLWTAARRRNLDGVLRQATATGKGSETPKEIGFFKRWSPDLHLSLTQPERRWTYDQSYVIAFIKALRPRAVHGAAGAPAVANASDKVDLGYYAGPILGLDICFAIAFAAFIVCASLLAGELLADYRAWLSRAAVIGACMGVVYGAADLAEDIMLRRILRHAEGIANEAPDGDKKAKTALADAAQVDAANALTRVKIVALCASITGLIGFAILMIADKAVAAIGSRGSGTPSPAATATS